MPPAPSGQTRRPHGITDRRCAWQWDCSWCADIPLAAAVSRTDLVPTPVEPSGGTFPAGGASTAAHSLGKTERARFAVLAAQVAQPVHEVADRPLVELLRIGRAHLDVVGGLASAAAEAGLEGEAVGPVKPGVGAVG